MASSTVLYENKDNIGIITLNRSERLNAINKLILGTWGYSMILLFFM